MKQFGYFILVTLSISFFASCNQNKTNKTTKVYFGEELLKNCKSVTINNSILKTYCLDINNDTNYLELRLNDSLIEFKKFENRSMIEKGYFLNNKIYGANYKYYQNGNIKKYEYFDLDTILPNYKKNFDEKGELISMWFNVKTSTFNENYNLDSISTLNIEIMNSMYSKDSLTTILIIEKTNETNITDTIYFNGSIAQYKFKPKNRGINIIKGNVFEIYGDNFGGEREFEFEYFVE